MAFLDWLSSIDPTRVARADTTDVEESKKKIAEAGAAGQQMIQQRMAQTKAPELERVSGPQAGKIDTGFLEALRGQLPSGQALLQRQSAQAMQAQQMQAESAQMARAAAMGEAPSLAQLQQKKAFEQAIAAQFAAQAGAAYDPARMYQAQVGGQQLMAQQAQESGILALQEQEKAKQLYADVAAKQVASQQTSQDLLLRAQQGDINAQLKLAELQSGAAQSQAEMATRTNIAGAEIAQRQAAQQAELQQQSQAELNKLTQLYVQTGMSQAQAESAAAQALFGSEQQRQAQQSGARAQIFGGILSGLAGAGAAYAGK